MRLLIQEGKPSRFGAFRSAICQRLLLTRTVPRAINGIPRRQAKKFSAWNRLAIAAALFVGRCVMKSPVELTTVRVLSRAHVFVFVSRGLLPRMRGTMRNSAHRSIPFFKKLFTPRRASKPTPHRKGKIERERERETRREKGEHHQQRQQGDRCNRLSAIVWGIVSGIVPGIPSLPIGNKLTNASGLHGGLRGDLHGSCIAIWLRLSISSDWQALTLLLPATCTRGGRGSRCAGRRCY